MNHEKALKTTKLLLELKQRIGTVESTTGGLIGASLLSCADASRFFISSCVVYSGRGYKTFLPGPVLKQSGVFDREGNYSGKEKYVESKRKFVDVVAKEMQKEWRADWMIVESGTVGPEFYIPGVKNPFTAIGVAGPDGQVLRVEIVEIDNDKTRAENMEIFTTRALEILHETVLEYYDSKKKSKL